MSYNSFQASFADDTDENVVLNDVFLGVILPFFNQKRIIWKNMLKSREEILTYEETRPASQPKPVSSSGQAQVSLKPLPKQKSKSVIVLPKKVSTTSLLEQVPNLSRDVFPKPAQASQKNVSHQRPEPVPTVQETPVVLNPAEMAVKVLKRTFHGIYTF